MTATRPGRARSEEARLAILLATRDELAERGYDKLSLDRVATAEDDEVAARYDEQLTTVTRVTLGARLDRAAEAGQVRADAPIATAVEAMVGLLSYHIVTRRDLTEESIDGVVRLLRDGVGA